MNSTDNSDDAAIFEVSDSMAFFSWLICEHPAFWRKIGALETNMVADELDAIRIEKPVYVAGLARSGSTILLELLAEQPGMVTQRYRDFPPVFTPYAWNRLLGHMKTTAAEPSERAHKDGIMVTEASPEAMEEPIWMSFFPDLHNPRVNNVLDGNTRNKAFEEFYTAHVRKLIAVHDGSRYLAKANYQITRLEYLLKLFPDARFILPVREPAAHIASLMKQHELFARGQAANPRARDHLRRVGHFEFGIDRVPVNTGDTAATEEVLRHWADGDELAGWIRYWSQIYGYLADRIAASKTLASATLFVTFEDLCAKPEKVLTRISEHCALPDTEAWVRRSAPRIRAPGYYKSGFTDAELFAIAQGTGATMDRVKALAR